MDEILDKLHQAEDEVERAKAAERLSTYKGEQAIRALIDALGDRDQLVQVSAAESLKKLYPEPQPYLRTALLSDSRLLVRWGAAELLADYRSPQIETALRAALNDKSADVRGAVARALRGKVRKLETITALRRLLDDLDAFPRYQALRTLRAFDPQLVDEAQVIRRDLESDDIPTRVAAIHFIREDGRQEWLSEVEKLLDHPDFRIRRAANWAWERVPQT
ncbi:MAG: HEAT repeat domain-containing protein [Anaerolineae bacterium]